MDDPEKLLYVVSGAVDVSGGYKLDAGAVPNSSDESVLVGVPQEFRSLMRERGFQIIADTKGIDVEGESTARQLIQTYKLAQKSTAPTPCTGGSSSGFPCNQIDLLSHTARADISANPNRVADIWGFVDLNTGREYAIVGVAIGTAVFDVTDAENPSEVGFIDGQNATWRDIKVYQFFDGNADRWRAYAYVTTDGASDGLFVIDLSGLPHSISQVPYASDFTRAHNVYLTGADYGTGLSNADSAPQLIIAGSGRDVGQFRTYSLVNPAAPAFVQRVAGAGYMHDATSFVVDDTRTASCANPGAPCEVLVDFNEEQVEVWDITSSANPSLIVRDTPYANAGYVHSGWWTEDRQFVLVHDELDERTASNPVTNTTVRVFSLANLASPVLADTWTGPTGAIDHNGFVRGNRYYMSNYSRGLTILDITDPTAPTDIGFFDTFVANNNPDFTGAWGAFPFFHSGTVAVSDINSGLYLLKDQSRAVAQGQLAFTQSAYNGTEGQQAQLSVERVGGSSGAISVDYEVVPATAARDIDYQRVTGRLNWADGETVAQNIAVDVVADAVTESLEHALVRLIDPQGGATLGDDNVASLYLSETGASAELRLFADAVDVPERGFGKAIVVVQRAGSANGAVSVDYSIPTGDATLNSDYTGSDSGTITWPDGDADPRFLEFDIVDDATAEPDEFFDVVFANVSGATFSGSATAQVVIKDGVGSNTAPNAIAGVNQVQPEGGQVTLDGSASDDPDGDPLTFIWSQTAGTPNVVLNNPTTATATFTAPDVASDTMLTFQLTVTDSGGLMDTATTIVTVTNSGGGGTITPTPPSRGGGGGGGTPAPLTLVLLAAIALVRASRRDCA